MVRERPGGGGAGLGLNICCSEFTCEYSAANCMQCKNLDSLFVLRVNSAISSPKCAWPAASDTALCLTRRGNQGEGKKH